MTRSYNKYIRTGLNPLPGIDVLLNYDNTNRKRIEITRINENNCLATFAGNKCTESTGLHRKGIALAKYVAICECMIL